MTKHAKCGRVQENDAMLTSFLPIWVGLLVSVPFILAGVRLQRSRRG